MRSARLLTLVLVVPLVVQAQAPRLRRLPRADEPVLARVLAMSDARTLDTALVDSALRAGGAHLRAATARAIGQVGGGTRVPRLRALLGDADSAVAAEAAFALGLLRDSAGVPALAAALGRLPAGVDAAWSLGEIGPPARETILRGLENGALSRGVTEMLLLSASRLRPVPLAQIRPHLSSPSVDVRRAAAYAIARPAVAGGVRALLALASSHDSETRMYVASAAGRRAAGDSLGALVIPALRALARDRDPRVRVNAARSLASHGDAERDAVVRLLRDADANVRVAAAQSLSTVADTALSWWTSAWAADTAFTFRRSLLESAARRGVELPALRGWLFDRDWRLRVAAVRGVQQHPNAARRATLLEPALRDSVGIVRAGAFGILLADTALAGRDSLTGIALNDPAMEVRMAGLGAMKLGPRPSVAVAAALDAYRRARDDRENDGRIQALAIVRAAWRADSLGFDDALTTSLRALPRPADPLERAAAAGVTPLSGWGAAAGERGPIASYDSVVRTLVRPALAGRPAIAELRTERGTMHIVLFAADAPLTVANFVRLARSGYYSGTRFHRVVPNFVAQDGDPTGTGGGGPGYAIRDELNRRRYLRGTLGMALGGPDTGGSQYFICHSAQPHLDGHYTVFGQLRAGAPVLDRLVQGDRILGVRIR